MALFIWFLVWLVHGAPYMLGSWNPWNVSAVAFCIVDILLDRNVVRSRW